MKKSLVLGLFVALSFVACKDKGADTTAPVVDTTAAPAVDTTAAPVVDSTATAPAADTVKH
jgi:hypothetical protein